MTRERRSIALSILLAVAAVGASCLVYDASLLVSSVPGGPDAGPSARADGGDGGDGGDGSDPCSVLGVPARPDVHDDTPVGELVFALRSLDVGLVPDAGTRATGFNIDLACTCPGPETCVPWPGAPPHCDDPGGRDVGAFKLFGQFSTSGGALTQERVERWYREGWFGLLLRLADYNGKADDPVVSLSVFESTGTRAKAAEPPKPPAFDGTDVWYIDPVSLVGLGPPYLARSADARAYVAGGVLVATIDLLVPMAGFTSDIDTRVSHLDFRGAVLTATLKKNVRGVMAIEDGQFTARWATRSVLDTLGHAADPLLDSGVPVCLGASYALLKARACQAADIVADPNDREHTHACNAVSSPLGFTAVAAQVGPKPGEAPDAGDPCPPNFANDDCP